MAVNKVIYGNTTLLDLTSDTVAADKILEGYTAHDKSGAQILGVAKQLGLPVIKRLGYLDNGWYFNTGGVLRFDEYDPDCMLEVFRVIANHKYIWCFGLKDGNRSTVAFTTVDILNHPVDGIQCDKKFAEGDQPPYFVKTILDISEDGYLGAYISNNQQGGKESYLIDITDIDSSTIARLGYKTITESGTYNALDDNLDGFAQVVVDISESGATLTVSYSEDFVGSTFTVTDGTTTLTDVATSSGEIEFTLPNGGTWEISATVDGVTYTEYKNIVLDYSTELVAIPDGKTKTPVNNIQTWLRCASITDKNYTTLTQVLLDMDTFIALISDSNACDYMARSTDWATDICADAEAMHLIGKYDYCTRALLGNSIWATVIGNSDYWNSVLQSLVPKMTSNTTPKGECFSAPNENQQPYICFSGNTEYGGNGDGNKANWYAVGYKFTSPVVIRHLSFQDPTNSVIRWNDYKLQASNDGINWTDLCELTTRTTTSVSRVIDNDTAYLYYRLYLTKHSNYRYIGAVCIQFYGRAEQEPIPLVPTMTSNTTPSGEVLCDTSMATGTPASDYYLLFDGAPTIGKVGLTPATTGFQYYGYNFGRKVNINRVGIWNGQTSGALSEMSIIASNDGSTWNEILYIGNYTNTATCIEQTFDMYSETDYQMWAVKCKKGSSPSNALGGIQFYFATHIEPPLVPKMTSNTTPSGEASASDIFGSGYEAYRAFSGDFTSATTGWGCSDSYSFPHWLQYEFPTAKVVRHIKFATTNISTARTFTQSWKLQGSNNSDFSSPVDLLTISNASITENVINYYDVNNDTAYKYYRFVFVSSSGQASAGNGLKLQFYTDIDLSSDYVILHSAVEDSLYYLDDDSPVFIGTTNENGDLLIDKDDLPIAIGYLTLYSTIAKNLEDLSNDYGRRIHFSKNLTEIYVMPNAELYWFGAEDNVEDCITANGWTTPNYNQQVPTHNKNSIRISVPSNGYESGIGSKKAIPFSIAKAIVKGITGDGSAYGGLTLENSKSIAWSDVTAFTNSVEALVTNDNDGINKYVCIATNNVGVAKAFDTYALWVDFPAKYNVFSAANDEIYYFDENDIQQTLCTTNAEGKGYFDLTSLPEGEYTFYSSVAKDPSNLSNDYSKTVQISHASEELRLLPDNVRLLYWFGYDSGDIEIATTSNGWTESDSNGTTTYNTNNITTVTANNKQYGIGTKNSITGFNKAHCIVNVTPRTTEQTLFILRLGKDYTTMLASADLPNNAMAHTELSITNKTGYLQVYNYNTTQNIYALWLE